MYIFSELCYEGNRPTVSGHIAKSLQDVMTEVRPDSEGVRVLMEFESYDKAISRIGSKLCCLFYDIVHLTEVANDHQQLHLKPHESDRLKDAEIIWQIRRAVESIQDKVDRVQEHLDILTNLSEDKIDLPRDEVLRRINVTNNK